MKNSIFICAFPSGRRDGKLVLCGWHEAVARQFPTTMGREAMVHWQWRAQSEKISMELINWEEAGGF